MTRDSVSGHGDRREPLQRLLDLLEALRVRVVERGDRPRPDDAVGREAVPAPGTSSTASTSAPPYVPSAGAAPPSGRSPTSRRISASGAGAGVRVAGRELLHGRERPGPLLSGERLVAGKVRGEGVVRRRRASGEEPARARPPRTAHRAKVLKTKVRRRMVARRLSLLAPAVKIAALEGPPRPFTAPPLHLRPRRRGRLPPPEAPEGVAGEARPRLRGGERRAHARVPQHAHGRAPRGRLPRAATGTRRRASRRSTGSSATTARATSRASTRSSSTSCTS